MRKIAKKNKKKFNNLVNHAKNTLINFFQKRHY